MIPIFLFGLLTVAYGQAYTPRGWAPEGQAFNLPPSQLQPQYGAPNTQYLPSQASARDFNRVETGYGAPNQYWQQNGQFTQQNLNNKQWNQNTAQTNQFTTANNKINIPQSNYDQSSQNSEPQPNFNRIFKAANQFQPNPNQSNNQPKRNNNENQYDFNLDSESNNQFGRIVPREQKMQTSDASDSSLKIVQDKPQNFNQNEPPATQPPQYNGKAPEDLLRINTDGKLNRAYGTTTTIKPDITTITTTEPESDDNENEGNESSNAALMAGKSMDTPMSGQYYLLLPDGRLQRVIYMTTADNANGYTANLMYENVEPLRGPIYSYNDAPLVRVN